MRDTSSNTTDRHDADTEDHVPEHISANEEREALSIERILRTWMVWRYGEAKETTNATARSSPH